jgi:hypothetical protein
MKTLKSLKAAMLIDPQTRSEYQALADEFDVARELIAALSKGSMAQDTVVPDLGTTQSLVARMGSGKRTP